jgi:hypothetical protein
MADPKPPGPGHNIPREADVLDIMAELRPGLNAVEAAQAVLKKAKNDYQVVRNKAEQRGFTLSILDKALKYEREPTNRRGQQAVADEEYLVFKTLGLPTAAVQGQLNFGSDEERDAHYWGEQGYQAGIRGDAAAPPDAMPPHLHQVWLDRRAAGVEYSAWGKAEAGGKPDQGPAGASVTTIDEARAAREGAGKDGDKAAETTAKGRAKGAAAKDPLLQ